MKIKRDLFYLAIIVILIGACAQVYYDFRYKPAAQRRVEVLYNADRELNKELIRLTQDADQFVYFGVYTFTRADLQDALLAAKYRGLEVVGIMDKDQSVKIEQQKDIIKQLRDRGIPVYEQDHSAIMHLKVLVTDKAYASGSYNWTAAATNLNDEVLEIGYDETIRKQYQNVMEEVFERYKDK